MKYKDWLSTWLEVYVKPVMKEKTYSAYANIVRLHIIPSLGEYELEDLGPLLVQQFVTKKLTFGNLKTGKGLSVNTVNSIIAVIQGSLETAYLLGKSSKYEMNKIKRPKNQEKTIVCFTKEEQKTIERAVMTDKRNKMKGIVLCLYTGLRIGELLALEWTDVDFQKAELRINKTCHDGKNEYGELCRITNSPKTSSSNRVIPLPMQMVPVLRELKKNCNSKYVISDKGEGISIRSYQRSFELLQKKLNIHHHGFHVLRHTFATRAIENGMDIKSLSEILGHKTPAITLNRYVHSLMEYKRSMMNKLGKIF